MTLNLKKVAKGFWDDEYLATRLYKSMGERYAEKAQIFNELTKMESSHGAFWEALYSENSAGQKPRASLWLKTKLQLLKFMMRLIGFPAFVRYLELNESGAIRTYGKLFDSAELEEYREGLRSVVLDEVQHEVALLSEVIRVKKNVDDVRNAVYGMVDSLVEVLAVVVGLAVALVNPVIVVLGGIITASAGTLSMSAGAYLSSGSQREIVEGKIAELSVRAEVMPERQAERVVHRLKEWGLSTDVASEVSAEIVKDRGLVEAMSKAIDLGVSEENVEDPLRAARSAGVSYFVGSLAPIMPFAAMVGGRLGIALSTVLSVIFLSVVSAVIAMLSGVSVKRKILQMDAVAISAALGTFVVGFIARTFLGISV
jgi:VIT1/CCC1 family predicted Fe2+/Mn2+ transporter